MKAEPLPPRALNISFEAGKAFNLGRGRPYLTRFGRGSAACRRPGSRKGRAQAQYMYIGISSARSSTALQILERAAPSLDRGCLEALRLADPGLESLRAAP